MVSYAVADKLYNRFKVLILVVVEDGLVQSMKDFKPSAAELS